MGHEAMKPYAYITLSKDYGESGVAMAIPALAVSVLYLALTLLLAKVARLVVSRITEEGSLVQQLLLEVIASAELCGCCFELVIIADNYGVWTYAAFLWALTVWWGLNWGSATACPYMHVEEVVEGNSDLVTAALKTAAELVGGVLVFRYVQYLWDFELAETHQDQAYADCTADLKVTMFQGAGIEGAATCAARIASKVIGMREIPMGNLLDALISTALVVAAFDTTGGYLNPVLATSLKYDCEGNTFEEHIIVYWVGACLGAVASIHLLNHPTIQKLLLGKEKAD
ncbi:aquaporin-11 [Anabrus simplex]|uniref:aquaporin-11 n=1 Tax=Anabrus simplex TaxID=316456 RepID=UPI0035A36FB0